MRSTKSMSIEPKKPSLDSDRAEAARDVLEHVYLSEKNFGPEALITEEVEQDAGECVWVTVKIHVPRLDIDAWIDGTHLDHPDKEQEEETA